MPGRLTRRLEERKKAYEARRRVRVAVLEAKRVQYERERASLLGLGVGISSVGRRPTRPPVEPSVWITRPYRGARVETIKPEPTPSREPLVDVFDEGKCLRVNVQFKSIPWPEDIIGELGEVSFKHGVLELKLKKRERGELTKAEKGALEAAEEGKVTAKVKEKLMMELKKRRKIEAPP